jgi:preprotein translocase subunit SecF
MQFFHGTKINFVGKKVRAIFFTISLSLIGLGVILSFIIPPEYGIDFEGGTEIGIAIDTTASNPNIPSISDVRKAVQNSGFTNSEIKTYGTENQFLIRLKSSENVREKIVSFFQNTFPNNKIIFLNEERIGAKIGSELRGKAFLAVGLSILAILIYVAFRFEFVYGLGAIIALIHDVIVTYTIMLITHHFGIMNLEIDSTILAAMLTVIGFSINDTVIIFDRIRENLQKHKGMSYVKLFNLSINETLSRTINTVLTVVLVLITMVLLGGPVLQGFAFVMLIGIIVGTYSSIYIASSFVLWFVQKIKKIDVESELAKKSPILGKAKA